MGMETLFTTEHPNDTRVRWVYDEHYETVGSYGYDTEEETKAAEDWELERLNDGRLVAMGAIVEERVDCKCPDCNGWHSVDTLWGIVIEPNEAKLKEFAIHSLDGIADADLVTVGGSR